MISIPIKLIIRVKDKKQLINVIIVQSIIIKKINVNSIE